MSTRNRRYEKKYATIARERNAAVESLVKGYPLTLTGVERAENVIRNLKTLDFTAAPILDIETSRFLRRFQSNPTRRRALEARLKALSFLQYHFDKETFSKLNDAILSNLQVLLTKEFQRGATFGRRSALAKAKKRK